MAAVAINTDGLNRARKRAGILDDKELARRAGVNFATLYRAINGHSLPGNRLIAGMLQTFGHAWFAELFDVIPDEVATTAPAKSRRSA